MTELPEAARERLSVAYLVNQYPKVSHSFIRREIHALERQGVDVQRFSVRGWDAELPDPDDRRERDRTRYLLRGGWSPLVAAAARAAFAAPRRFVRALGLALRLARGSERPWPYHLVYLCQACLLRGWLRESAIRHLHAHFGTNPAEVALLLHTLDGTPYSITVHGPEEFDKPAALHLAEKIGGASFVVAVSSYGRSQLYRWAAHGDWPRIEVVHCGVDPSFHAASTTVPGGAGKLVCVGRLCEQKGQLLLVAAVAELIGRGRRVQLVLAGDGELRGAIERFIDELGVRDAVRITGWIASEAVREEILAARAMVLPSFAEGLPVVIMEAMALRRPVVSTFIAGIPELVVDQETGWLVPAGDAVALSAALEACLDASDDRVTRMGDAARSRVLANHDVDREAARLAALFTRGPAVPALDDPAR